MKVTTKQLKQIINEELHSLLSEQSLRGYLTAQGMSEEEMMDMMNMPGGMAMLNLIREFEFQSLQGTGMPRWQREVMWERGTHKDLEIQTITLYGKYGAGFKRHGPRWEKGPSWRKTFRERHYDDYEEAATDIAKLITPPEKEMFMGQLMEEEEEVPKVNRHAHKIAEMILSGKEFFQQAKEFIKMGIVPMEDIVLAVKERVTPIYHELTKLGDKRSDLYSDLAGAERMDDYTWSDKLSWDINDVTKQWRQTNIPLNNIYDFWKTADVDADNDFIDEVDKLLQDEELRQMIPGFRQAWKGNYDWDEDDYGIV